MSNLFVLMFHSSVAGVYTDHRKATQAMITNALANDWVLTEYQYSFGVEFYTFKRDGAEAIYEIQEVPPDTWV